MESIKKNVRYKYIMANILKKLLPSFLLLFILAVSTFAALEVDTDNFYLEVAKGNVLGHSIINKFGHNPAAATGGEDVWGGGGTYAFYPTTAQTMEAVSSDNDDNVGDTGARLLLVFGLNSSWDEVSEYVTLTGTTPVALNHTYIRMYRAVVISVGSSESNEGNIQVRETGAGDIGAYIAAGDGQTQQAIYTIPRGKTGYFIKGYVALGNDNKNGEDGTFQWKARLNNGFTGAWAVKGQVNLVNIGSSHWQYEYGAPSGGIPEKTDIRIAMTEASATMDIVGGFDLVLVDNNLTSTSEDEEMSIESSFGAIAIILVCALIIASLLWIVNSMDDEHGIYKALVYLMVFVIFIIAGATVTATATGLVLYKLSLWLIPITFIYILIYLFYKYYAKKY